MAGLPRRTPLEYHVVNGRPHVVVAWPQSDWYRSLQANPYVTIQTAAVAQLTAIWDNVQLMASSARTTLTLFELGAGDALVTYEQDAVLAQERGVPLEIVIPASTILQEEIEPRLAPETLSPLSGIDD